MAQVVVDSSVMRDKSKTLENAAVTIQSLYAEMLQEVTTTANKMKGTTIETEKKQFAGMQNTFDTIVKDMKAYSTFLTQAAESYEAAEREGTQKAQDQGKIF
ncbi:WXG100 family type VII secretion target [Intestinibacillus sp. Marseille-P6563]|uniref:WXG100 family type VII secretion target n=1 Tax=Intestinibacillus sp. Marseille-P6563 TaxID=2364792 RepID=UPI000F061C86|nr:WXG100 family type VII secretion target [Intestinibacillus sp. Marseille-P6563]